MIKNYFTRGLTLLLIVGCQKICCANDNFPVGARSAALSHASVMLMDFWSVFHNQAGLIYVKDLSLGVSYSNGFIPSMGEQFIGAVIPVSKGAFGATMSYYGYSDYYELKSGIAYSMMLTEGLSAGIQMDYFNTHISGFYDDVHLLTFELGLIYRLNKEIYLGFHVFNPLNYQVRKNTSEMPSVMRLGVGYQLLEDLLLCGEIEKELDKNLNLKMGIEYLILDRFVVRTGISSLPFQNSFGIGYKWNELKLGVSFLRHNILGYSPSVSLDYKF